jgi:diguanylate cyclase (GGDEF)-like protein/PAS domain S-box-containing protein
MIAPTDAATYEELYEHAPCGLMSTSMDGTILRLNGTLRDWIGEDDSCIGQPFVNLLAPGGRMYYETRQRPLLLLQGEMREVAMRLQKAGGGNLDVLVNSRVMFDEKGEAIEIRSAVFDATERQQYERELIEARHLAEQSSERLNALQNATSAFIASESEQEVIEALTEAVRTAVGAIAVAAVRARPDGSFAIAGGRHLLDEVAPGTVWPVYYEALRTMEHQTIGRIAEADEVTAEAMRAAGVESFTVLPAQNDDGNRGFIVSFFGRERELSEAAIDLKQALTKQAMQTLKSMRLQNMLEQLALYDGLTGLANRKLLQEQLDAAIASALRDGASLGLMFIDLDGFKAINDTLGHVTGDEVLCTVAERLTAVVRQNDLVGRLGGDEFIVICETVDEDSAANVAERIVESIRAPYEGVPPELALSASVGVVLTHPSPHHVPTGDELLVRADAAMYNSKNTGRDRVTIELV